MKIEQFDFNLLKPLSALLEEKNVTHAGERLNLTQPTMSAALARLRTFFRDPLLVRVGRDYSLTPLAEQLVGPVQEMLRLLEETLEARPTFEPRSDVRSFTIAASDYLGFRLIQPLLQRVLVEAPGVSLFLKPFGSGTNKAIESHELDLVICDTARGPKLPNQVLFRDRWVCAVSKDNHRIGSSITDDEFLAMPHLAPNYSAINTTILPDSSYEALRPSAVTRMATETLFLLPFFLRDTSLIALIPEQVAKTLADICSLRLIEPPFETNPIVVAMYWHPKGTFDPALIWLRSMVQGFVESQFGPSPAGQG